MIDTPVTANMQSLERVINNPLPKLLIFYKNHLPENLEQPMKTLAKAEAEKLLVVKIDLAENTALAAQYKVTTTPTIIAMRGNQETGRTTDANQLNAYADYAAGKISQLPAEPAPKKAGTGKPVTITDQNFAQEVLQSDIPVLLDLWAAWCPPCRMIAPTLEKLAGEFEGRVKIAKLNVDEQQKTARQFRVQGIPTLLMFKNGKEVDRVVGAAPEANLRAFLQKFA